MYPGATPKICALDRGVNTNVSANGYRSAKPVGAPRVGPRLAGKDHIVGKNIHAHQPAAKLYSSALRIHLCPQGSGFDVGELSKDKYIHEIESQVHAGVTVHNNTQPNPSPDFLRKDTCHRPYGFSSSTVPDTGNPRAMRVKSRTYKGYFLQLESTDADSDTSTDDDDDGFPPRTPLEDRHRTKSKPKRRVAFDPGCGWRDMDLQYRHH